MIGLATFIRTNRLQQIASAIDAAVTPGEVLFYSGTRPATGAAITTQLLQATVVLNQPCATVAAALMTFDIAPVIEGMRIDDESITWARFTDGDSTFCMDADVTGTGGGGDIVITNVAGFIGGFVRIESGVIGE